MPKLQFKADVVVEASSEEEALALIAGRLSAIRRHVGNGEKLAASRPFFTLSKAPDKAEAADLTSDPIVKAREAQE